MSNSEAARAEAGGGAKACPELGRKDSPEPGRTAPSPSPRDARRTAAAILEVLAGACTPAEAAAVLAVSLPRYYMLETRALEGLVAACEPHGKGRGRSPEKELADVRRESERLRKECARYQSLARVSQRAAGFIPPAKPKPAAGRVRRKRKPVVRALVAATKLRAPAGSSLEARRLAPAPAQPAGPALQPEGEASARAGRHE